MFLYLLNISLPFHFVYIVVFGVHFPKLEVCGSSLLWSLLSVCGVGLVACQGFLIRGLGCVFWWVELDLFPLKFTEVSSSEFWCVYRFGMALSSLSFNPQGCVPALLET